MTRRDLDTLLARYREVIGDTAVTTPADGWRRFFDSVDRRFLVAIIRGLMSALPTYRRAGIEYFLGLSADAFSCTARIDFLRRDSAQGITIRIPLDTQCENIVRSLASGKYRRPKGARRESIDRCNPIALLEQLRRLNTAMKPTARLRGPNLEKWLLAELPPVFQQLVEVACGRHTIPNGAPPHIVHGWSQHSSLPLEERVLAWCHAANASKMHQAISSIIGVLSKELSKRPLSAPDATDDDYAVAARRAEGRRRRLAPLDDRLPSISPETSAQ
jgi:hypothetical protein